MSSSCQGTATRQTEYLTTAVQAAQWLQRLQLGGGPIPDEITVPYPSTWDLGSGAAGRGLFFLELFHATRDSSFLVSAQREIHSAVAAAVGETDAPPLGLYAGLTGAAFAATELYRMTGNGEMAATAALLMQGVRTRFERQDSWPVAHDVLGGAAGIGLAALAVARGGGDSMSLQLAVDLGDVLLSHAREAASGFWWSRTANADLNLPNFSHGTAGIGYFLAALYWATGETRFLNGAQRAATYLNAVADQIGGLFLVPYGIPNDEYVTAYDVGWAHGPAGTANLFVALDRLTGEPAMRRLVEANSATLRATGMPGPSADSAKWSDASALDRRFGISGALTFLSRLARHDDRSDLLPLAQAVGDDVIRRGELDGEGASWTIPFYGFQRHEGGEGRFTGFFYGAAGIGLALLDLHYALTGTEPWIHWPDDGFLIDPPR